MASGSDQEAVERGGDRPTQESHANLLQLYCRVCGRRNVKTPTPYIDKDNGVHFDQAPVYRSFLSRLHDVDVASENQEIFPKRVCHACVQLFQSGVSVSVQSGSEAETGTSSTKAMKLFELVNILYIASRTNDLRLLQRTFPVADFWAHSSSVFQDCNVCHDTGSGVDLHASSAYKATVRHGLAHGKKLKTFITVKPEQEDGQTGSEELLYKIVSITSGIVSVVEPPPISQSKVSPARVVQKQVSNGDGDDLEVVVVTTSKRPADMASAAVLANRAKKRKIEGLNHSANQWPPFNGLLGQNRKCRADKLGEILNAYQVEVPKVLNDLRSSGITYKPNGGQTHFAKNTEFSNSLSRCFSLLSKVPTSKKSLLLFRAITETASDGQLSILSYVGIVIDLTNPNLAFLLRRIKNFAVSKTERKIAPKTKSNTTVVNVTSSMATAAKLDAVKKRAKPFTKPQCSPTKSISGLPKGITISKVSIPVAPGAGPAANHKPGPKSKRKAVPEVLDLQKVLSTRTNTPGKIGDLINKLNVVWPANRQLRADVLRDLILGMPGSKAKLLERGIVFDASGGSYHLKALNGQRSVHKKQADKMMESLNGDEWTEFVSALVYDLLHPDDSLTLRIVGLFVDPLNTHAPFYFRMLYALKKVLKVDEDPVLSKTVLERVIRTMDVNRKGLSDLDLSKGLMTLLYCEEKESKEIVANFKETKVDPATPMPTKPKSASVKKQLTGSAKPKRAQNDVPYADDSDDDYVPTVDEDDDYDEILPRSTRRSSSVPVKYDDSIYYKKQPSSSKQPNKQPKKQLKKQPKKQVLLGHQKTTAVSVKLERIKIPPNTVIPKPKRGRGRPRKLTNQKKQVDSAVAPIVPPVKTPRRRTGTRVVKYVNAEEVDPLGDVKPHQEEEAESDPFADSTITMVEIKSETIKAELEAELNYGAVTGAVFEESDNPIEVFASDDKNVRHEFDSQNSTKKVRNQDSATEMPEGQGSVEVTSTEDDDEQKATEVQTNETPSTECPDSADVDCRFATAEVEEEHDHPIEDSHGDGKSGTEQTVQNNDEDPNSSRIEEVDPQQQRSTFNSNPADERSVGGNTTTAEKVEEEHDRPIEDSNVDGENRTGESGQSHDVDFNLLRTEEESWTQQRRSTFDTKSSNESGNTNKDAEQLPEETLATLAELLGTADDDPPPAPIANGANSNHC